MFGKDLRTRSRRLVILVAIVYLFTSFGFCGLLGQVPLSQMYHKSWTARDGMPNGFKNAAQGPDGFLWITTEDGLYRFDGVSFERYQPPSGAALLSDRMNFIMVAHDGSVWISYILGGVTRIKGDKITNFTEKEGLRPGHIADIAEDKDGRIWMTGAKGLQFIKNDQVVRFSDKNGVGKEWGISLTVDHDGNLWMPQEDQGVMVLARGSDTFIAASKRPFFSCHPAHDAGVFCAGDEDPITHFKLSNSKILSHPVMKPASAVWDLFSARDGTVWIATAKGGIQRFSDRAELAPGRKDSGLEVFGQNSGLTGERVESVFEDKEGSMWAFTNRGLDQFRPMSIQEVPLKTTQAVLPTHLSGSRFFVATDRLAEIVDGQISDVSPAMEGSDSPVCVYQADDGVVWIGSANGLRRYNNGRLEMVPLPFPSDGALPLVSAVVEDSSHGIWASIGDVGLFRLDKNGWSRRAGVGGLPGGVVFTSLRDSQGNLWFGFRNGILGRVAPGRVTTFDSLKGLAVGDIWSLSERNGSVWVGGERGIAVFDHDSFRSFSLDQGKQLRGVTGLAFSMNGDLWINSVSGVFQIVHADISKWDRKTEASLPWRRFDYLDGLNGIPSHITVNPTAALASDGSLYLSIALGFERLDPLHLPLNTIPPQVWITRMTTTEGSRPVSSKVVLNPDTKELEIGYTATSLLIPERVRFRYQLIGYDKDWIDVGTRRQAFYTKLPAGTYTFRVTACNDSGLWSTAGTSITLTVLPTLTETIWFKLGVLMSLAALTYVGFRFRMRQLKSNLTNRLTERFAERERIARDLHDTLFQGVEGGLLHINAVTSRIPLEPTVRDQLNGAYHELNQVMAAARSLIFDASTPAQSLNFEEIIVAYGEQVGLLSECKFSVTSLGKKREIKAAVCQELLKIIKESLANAFRHAGAKEIEVQISYTRTALEISVCDDGVGIDPVILEDGGRRGHWGLTSMRQRATEINAQLNLLRRPRGGTEVQIRISASRAFRLRAVELFAKLLTRNRNAADTAA